MSRYSGSRIGMRAEVADPIANTLRETRVRSPRSCYSYCMISRSGEILPVSVFKSPGTFLNSFKNVGIRRLLKQVQPVGDLSAIVMPISRAWTRGRV